MCAVSAYLLCLQIQIFTGNNCNDFLTMIFPFFKGTLPPPYSAAVPSEANGSLSSPVSTMTSQDSASSISKQRQSWMDLVSQASPPTAETAVVCSVQVHTQHTHKEEEDPRETESVASQANQGPAEKEQQHPGAQLEGETCHVFAFALCCLQCRSALR